MDYADQLIAESRNDVYHKADYTHKCRCWGKCFDEYKKTVGMDTEEFKKLYGQKELNESSSEYPSANYEICKTCSLRTIGCHFKDFCTQQVKSGKITKVYYGPWRDFLVNETGIWTTIKCPVCGYTNFWSVGDGDALF